MKLKNKKETIFFRNINFNSNLFYKTYFFFSLIILIVFILLVVNTGFWERNKNLIKSRAELNGVINYLKIPEILTHKFKSIFIKQNKIYLNINFKLYLIFIRIINKIFNLKFCDSLLSFMTAKKKFNQSIKVKNIYTNSAII